MQPMTAGTPHFATEVFSNRNRADDWAKLATTNFVPFGDQSAVLHSLEKVTVKLTIGM